MPNPAQPSLVPGRVYRTRDLAEWGSNPTRLAKRLLAEGRLRQLVHGLFYAPKGSRFGSPPPDDDAVLRSFLGDQDFVFTGPPRWNALGLGSTAEFSATLVYNSKRSGEFQLGGRRFHLRRVRHPANPTAEWFAVDLLEHHDMAGASLSELEHGLMQAIAAGRLDRGRLRNAAREFGTRATQALVNRSVQSETA